MTGAPWLDQPFLDRYILFCSECAVADPIGMLGTWMSESGLRPNAHNPHGDASGLFQAMPQTLQNLGVQGGWQQFVSMTAAAQVDVARRYYKPYKGKLLNAPLCYLATFLPKYLFQNPSSLKPDLVICSRGGPLPWAYAANAVFDKNGDYAITLGELEDAILRNTHGAVWEDASIRVAQALRVPIPPARGLPQVHDLSTTLGIQEALATLNFDPGELDGMPGRKTRGALVTFQATRGLIADGVPGPITRAALSNALKGISP